MAEAGYAQYEVSAYARPGRQCAHNLNYWRFGDYLGVGAGAHGKLTLGARQQVLRRWKVKHPAEYQLKAGTEAAIGGDDLLDAARLPFDFMLNALRLNEGVPIAMFEVRTGLSRSAIAGKLATARVRGWLEADDDWVRPTELGRRFTNDVIGLFLD
jgi:oxygen-independent coproporphyrinogen-3 oxidase